MQCFRAELVLFLTPLSNPFVLPDSSMAFTSYKLNGTVYSNPLEEMVIGFLFQYTCVRCLWWLEFQHVTLVICLLIGQTMRLPEDLRGPMDLNFRILYLRQWQFTIALIIGYVVQPIGVI